MKKHQIKSRAKINLSLLVYHPKKNGYHSLCSVFQLIFLADTLQITTTAEKKFTLICPNPAVPTDERNILYKAYNLLKKDLPFGLKIKLQKNIPIGAGLGGGSSNAAALINFLNKKANLGLSQSRLINLGKKIGADVPFFLSQESIALVRGIGEKITPLKKSPYQYFVLITPPLHVSTKEVYQAFDKTPAAQKKPAKTPQNFLKKCFGQNDLKPVVFNKYPTLKKLSAEIEFLGLGQVYMSGSGATLFVPFKSLQDSVRGEKILKAKYPQFLIVKTKTSKP